MFNIIKNLKKNFKNVLMINNIIFKSLNRKIVFIINKKNFIYFVLFYIKEIIF